MRTINTHVPIITLNNGHRLAFQFRKQNTFCCPQENFLSIKGRLQLRVKHWKVVFQGNGDKKQTDIGILISENLVSI